MNLETKKDLASNWFKTLQDSFCDDILKLEKNKLQFKSTIWKRNPIKDEGGVCEMESGQYVGKFVLDFIAKRYTYTGYGDDFDIKCVY